MPHIITLNELRVINRRAWRALDDEQIVSLSGDDRVEVSDDGTLCFYTRGGDPDCELKKHVWMPNVRGWDGGVGDWVIDDALIEAV